MNIHLGYELGTGKPVEIPLRHMAVTGQTQESGKTTTLEALVERGNLRAIAFVTKRAEGSFRSGRRIRPYFRERADWQFVSALLEATLRERLKFERSWIMRACKGARTLGDVHQNIRELMAKAKGLSADVYMTLDEYLQIVIPQIRTADFAEKLDIATGLNVVDVSGFSMEVQALVIRSTLEWVYEREHDTVTVIPEAWEFIPQNRASPVLLAAEQLIRKGAAAHNYMWLDSQDIAGVHKNVLRSVIVWLLGVQRENNEVKRMLEHVPSVPKPTVREVMQLGKGQFYACWSDKVIRTYVQPSWVSSDQAEAAARGVDVVVSRPSTGTSSGRVEVLTNVEENDVDKAERERYEKQIERLTTELTNANEALHDAEREIISLRTTTKQNMDALGALAEVRSAWSRIFGAPATNGHVQHVDTESIVREVLKRMPAGGGTTIVAPPAEVLRKKFQIAEVQRILEYLRALDPRVRDALTLLESTGTWYSFSAIAARLGISQGDRTMKLNKGLKAAAADGYLELKERQGLHAALREKIMSDLAAYGPDVDDIEQTYNACMVALAEAVPA